VTQAADRATYDTVIRGGTVFDGSGGLPAEADVASPSSCSAFPVAVT
jgi:hypothetical protein